MKLDNVSVVLVASQGERNIGSVARAMANFGLSDLRLVAPQADHLQDEARKMAVKATTLLENARIFPDLASALADCHYAYGSTRRFGKYRVDFLHPDEAARQMAPMLEKGRIALVFGREDKGLKTEELDLCQRLITIPTDEGLPSMNLAQSVVICLYELRRQQALAKGLTSGRRQLANNRQLEEMFDHMRRTFLDIEYLDPQNPEHIMRAYRQILGRSGLDARDVRILRGLLSRIEWLESERRRLSGMDDDETV